MALLVPTPDKVTYYPYCCYSHTYSREQNNCFKYFRHLKCNIPGRYCFWNFIHFSAESETITSERKIYGYMLGSSLARNINKLFLADHNIYAKLVTKAKNLLGFFSIFSRCRRGIWRKKLFLFGYRMAKLSPSNRKSVHQRSLCLPHSTHRMLPVPLHRRKSYHMEALWIKIELPGNITPDLVIYSTRNSPQYHTMHLQCRCQYSHLRYLIDL